MGIDDGAVVLRLQQPTFREALERDIPLRHAQAHQRLGQSGDGGGLTQRGEATSIGRPVEQTGQSQQSS